MIGSVLVEWGGRLTPPRGLRLELELASELESTPFRGP